jgi:hypothetical protein
LLDGVGQLLGDGPVDQHISIAIRSIDIFEQFSVSFSVVFERMLWVLRSMGGSGSCERLLHIGEVGGALEWCRQRLANLLPGLRQVLADVGNRGPFVEQDVPSLLAQVLSDAEHGVMSPDCVLDAVLLRHERVQREKRKPPWMIRSASWTLMPGTPVVEPRRLDEPESFVHPYRLVNSYSLMSDLRLVKGVRPNGEDQGE